MPVVRFAGCRSDSLLGYLKALGVLRLLGTQIDPACVGAWDEATFSISTSLSKEAIEEFFVASYSPTPVLNLWNNGAGFDGKNDSAANTLRRITEAKGTRWEPYRRSLAFINDRYISSGMIGQYLDNNDKIDAKKKPADIALKRCLCGSTHRCCLLLTSLRSHIFSEAAGTTVTWTSR